MGATETVQFNVLFAGFNAFGDHDHPQVAGQRNDGRRNCPVIRIAGDSIDEAAVDLQLVNGKALKVGERTEARAKIVDADLQA